MKVSCAFCGLLLAITLVNCSPIVKRDAEEDLSPLNEVYVIEEESAQDDDRSDRDKRKIGIVKLGVTNGIINFVFGKLDAFLDAKTKALAVLDESNKAKNAAFDIDNTQSATGKFISHLISQKIQASTGSIGPIINSASTFISGAKGGVANAFAAKLAPLSSLSGGLSGGHGGSGGSGGAGGILSGLLSSKIGSLSSLSGGSGGLGSLSGSSGGSNSQDDDDKSSNADASAGINLGAFANVGAGGTKTTTEENIPEFDRSRVSLDLPSEAIGGSFTLITNISKILSSLITNSAKRTESVLEVFKPVFRGAFAIKGLPSDNPK